MMSRVRQAERGAAATAEPCSGSDPEPDHFIQGHGALMVLADGPEPVLEQASANLAAFLGVTAEAALGRPLAGLLSPEAAITLGTASEPVRLNGRGGQQLFAWTRRRDGGLVVELEPAAPADCVVDGLADRPAEGFAVIEATLAVELEAAGHLYDIARATVEAVSEIARFDRTLISRFLTDGSGEVIAEVKRSTATAFLGLRFPSSELPAAERAAALTEPLRVIADVSGEPVPLVPPLNQRTGRAADLAGAVLRPAPPAALRLLRARGVATALTLALVVEGRLWGMLACHHETPRLVEPALRAVLAGIAGQAIAALTRVVTAERIEAERQVARRLAVVEQAMLHSDNTVRQLLASDPGLLDLATADGLAVVAGDGVASFGQTPDTALIRRLAARVAERPDQVLAVDHLAGLLPEAAACRAAAAGMLAVALTVDPPVVIAAFRRELVHEVIWGGDPGPAAATATVAATAEAAAAPGAAFAHWRETVVGHCRPWEPEAVVAWQGLPAWLGTAFGSHGAAALRLVEDLSVLMPPSRFDEPFLRALLNAVAGMLVVGQNAPSDPPEVLVANRDFRQLFGVVPDILIGQPVTEVLAAIGLGDPAIAALAPGGTIDATVITAGFGERNIRISQRPLLRLTQEGERSYAAWVFEDVTRPHRVEAALRSAREQAVIASRAKTEFLAHMSHELRTPLNTIIGFAEIMRAELFGALGSAKYKEYIRNIQTSGESLLSVIRNVLDISKVEAGHYVLEEQVIDLAAVLQSVCLAETGQAERAGVRLMQEVAARRLPVQADERAIRQMLLNLLSNSFKFTPAGGMVTCRALVLATGGIALEVQDTGIGMPEDYLNRVLDPFVQAGDRHRARKPAGTGIGLALVRVLAELHGGRVTVTSHARRGTAIRVGLPSWRTMPSDGSGTPPPQTR
ncbi:MAG: ATP-binding protein [Rhodospirillaceae bacterium]